MHNLYDIKLYFFFYGMNYLLGQEKEVIRLFKKNQI